MKVDTDQRYNSLFITNKFALIIPDKHRESNFQDIVLAKAIIDKNSNMFLHYMSLFSYGKLG